MARAAIATTSQNVAASGGLFPTAMAVELATFALSAVQVEAAVMWSAVAFAVCCIALLLVTSALCDYDGLGLATWRIRRALSP